MKMGTRSALMPKPWLPPQLYAVSLNLRTTGIILGRLGMAKTREPGNLPAMNETRTLGWRVIGSSYVHVFVFCSRCGFHAGHFRASGSCRPSWLLHHRFCRLLAYGRSPQCGPRLPPFDGIPLPLKASEHGCLSQRAVSGRGGWDYFRRRHERLETVGLRIGD